MVPVLLKTGEIYEEVWATCEPLMTHDFVKKFVQQTPKLYETKED